MEASRCRGFFKRQRRTTRASEAGTLDGSVMDFSDRVLDDLFPRLERNGCRPLKRE